MYAYDVTYEDFDGKTVTEKLYFRYSQNELTRLHIGGKFQGTPEELLEKMNAAEGRLEILDLVEDFLLGAYGERAVVNGRDTFVKNEELKNGFKNSLAWEQLFDDVSSDSDLALAFVRNVMPSKVQTLYDDEKVSEQVQNVFGQDTLDLEPDA